MLLDSGEGHIEFFYGNAGGHLKNYHFLFHASSFCFPLQIQLFLGTHTTTILVDPTFGIVAV